MEPKKFTVSRKELAQALKLTSKSYLSPGFCEKYGIPFAHSCIVFTAYPPLSHLDVYTFTGDMAVSVCTPISTDEEDIFTFAFMAQDILPVFRRLEGEELQFLVHEKHVRITHSNGSFSVPLVEKGLNDFKANFDSIQAKEKPLYIELEAESLRSVLNRQAFAMARDELRPVMKGVHIRTGGETVDFVASDGHKLVRIQKPVKDAPMSRMNIPAHAVKVLRHILPRKGTVKMYYSTAAENTEEENNSVCHILMDNKTEFWFIPTPGKYPDFTKVIPVNLTHVSTVDRNMLLKSLDRLHFFTSLGHCAISMKESCLQVKVSDKDFNLEAEERIPATLQGSAFTFGMNIRFLTETLRNIHTRNIQIAGNGTNTPFIIRPENQPESETITMLVMPLMLDDEE